MKPILSLKPLLLLTVAVLGVTPALAEEVAVVGVWDILVSTTEGDIAGVMTITEEGGTLDVEMVLDGLERRVSDETLEGNNLTMTVYYDEVPYEVELTVYPGAMEGTYSGGNASGSLTAKRRP
jgi:hypothetical protein